MTTPAAAPVVALYRGRLAAVEARNLVQLARLWQAFDPALPLPTLAAVGAPAAVLVTVAQAAFMAEALVYLQSLYAAASGAPLAGVAPFTAPAGVTGWTAAGAPVPALTTFAPSVYAARLATGRFTEAEAAESALAYLRSLVVSEPYRAANETVLFNARADGRLTGRVNRVTEPGACPFCLLIADRGYIPEHAGFAAHRNCRCTAAPEVTA